MAKIVTSTSFTREQLEELKRKANEAGMSRSEVVGMGADIVCGMDSGAVSKIFQIGAIMNIEPSIIMMNMLTARAAQMEVANHTGLQTTFPELVDRKLKLNELVELLK